MRDLCIMDEVDERFEMAFWEGQWGILTRLFDNCWRRYGWDIEQGVTCSY